MLCCASLSVAGGTFRCGYETNGLATVSDLRLDKYEVTVRRFRKFVAATIDGWLPPEGSAIKAATTRTTDTSTSVFAALELR